VAQLPTKKESHMQHKPLQQALQPHFSDLDPRRLDFIARFIIALLHVSTVNLNKLGAVLSSKQVTSNARRIKRFLNYDLSIDFIAKFVLSFIKDDQLVLTMDRFLPLTSAPDGLGAQQLEVWWSQFKFLSDRHRASRHRHPYRLGQSRQSWQQQHH
jgi:hypothetical protein